MSNTNLEEKLNIVECDIVGQEISQIKSMLKKSKSLSDDTSNDYVTVRDNLGKLLEQGNKAVESILQVAAESNHPRAFEVVSTMIKTTADVAEQLITLQEKMKKLKKLDDDSEESKNNTENHQHLHVEMTTDQLNKILDARN